MHDDTYFAHYTLHRQILVQKNEKWIFQTTAVSKPFDLNLKASLLEGLRTTANFLDGVWG